MANTSENVQINLKINGLAQFETLKDLNSEVIAQRRSLEKLKITDPGYNEAKTRLNTLIDAQQQWRTEIYKGKEEQKSFWKEFKQGFSEVKSIAGGVALGSLLAGGIQSALSSISAIPGKIRDAYGEAQKFRAILTNAFKGDGKTADNAMSMLQEYAAQTPFGLKEATEGFIALVNRGINPTKQEMVQLGDVAASQGKTLDMYIQAVLDSMTGENERLKEFGIMAKKNGDKVAFTFKGVTKEVANTEDAIKKALISFGAMEGVAGTMESVSKTVVGLRSNIEDSWDQIFTKIGQRSEGFIAGFYRTYADALDFINDKILGTKTKADDLTETWETQGKKVQLLEKNTLPLLNRYDELKSKAKLNKDEQAELQSVINTIADTIPSAVTAFDKYGKALGINTEAARKYVKVQQELLKFQNKEAIKETQAEIGKMQKERDSLLKLLNGKTVTEYVGGNGLGVGGKTVKRNLTDEEITKMRDKIIALNDGITDTNDRLDGLTGNYLSKIRDAAEEGPKAFELTTATIGDMKKRLKELNDQLEKTVKGSAEYKKIKSEIDQITKILSSDKQASQDAKKAEKEKEAIEKLLDQVESLKEKAYIESLDRYQAETKAIEFKYQREREEAKKTFKDKSRLAQAMTAITEAEATEVAAALARMDKEQQEIEKKSIEQSKEKFIKYIEDKAAAEQTILEAGMSAREQEQLAIDRHYETLINLATQFGLDTTNLFSKWTRAKIDLEFQAENEKNIALKEQALLAAKEIAGASLEIISNNRRAEADARISQFERERDEELSNRNLTERQKDAINKKYDEKIKQEKLKAWKAEQRAAIAQAVINAALAMTKVAAQSGMLTFAFSPLIAATTAAQIAVIAAQKAPQFKKGGFIPNGPSHENRGISLINNQTGQTLGEMEGGEPIMILSKETRRNNEMLINELLYNSQHRNGAPVRVNTGAAVSALSSYKNGGYISTTTFPQSASPSGGELDMDAILEKLDVLVTAVKEANDKQVVLPLNQLEEKQRERQLAIDAQSA